ncbi:tetratricopeptide repeat protein [Erythrobacter litoralis]|uniref:Ancillary SecYEG translocon subunit/Cell division coordinator CpoB TPR domain-containing protein n=1 Tax=Erythrobacter litoralis (strain HTCC2594) TaxID=314225 RepID=Q2NCC1_ERYLH|nr:tetratricopeptide repeat protein [Erythrobacter litoralis]ABC62670.1 hypothetical protein ELI_02890 [Erythrobacter litoralis HTCC2594]
MALPPANTPPATPKPEDEKKARLKAAQDEAALREIDEAVRQDQYAEFGRTYGRPLLVLLVVGLAAFGGYLWWDGQREAALEQDSEVLVSALDQIEAGNLQTGTETLEPLTTSDNAGAQAAALMLQAGIAAQQGDLARAATLFGQVANNSDAPPAYRDLATVRQVALQFDRLEPAEVIQRLSAIAVPDNAFFGSAGELVAMAHLEKGDRAAAGKLFGEIAKSDDAPQSLRSRARQMAGMLGVDAIEDVDEVLEEAGADTSATSVQGTGVAQ